MPKILASILVLVAYGAPLAAADAAAETTKPKPYPLATCIVSGDKLGSMGDAVVVVRDGREIKFCCKGCIKDFDKDPAKFIAKIAEAEQAAKAGKPAATDHANHH